NVGVAGYNGTFTIVSVPDTTHFTYTNPTAGLIPSRGGTVQSAVTITARSNQITNITATDIAQIQVGMVLTGPGFATGATVVTKNTSDIIVSVPALASGNSISFANQILLSTPTTSAVSSVTFPNTVTISAPSTQAITSVTFPNAITIS